MPQGNFISSFLDGRQAAQDDRYRQRRNALADMDLDRAKRVNALAGNPSATPEEYARAGDPQTANALAGARKFSQEEQISNARMLNAASAEIMQNPEAASRWMPQLERAGVVDARWRSLPPDQLQAKAAEFYKSTSAALAALDGQQDTGPLEQIVGDDGQPQYATRRDAVGRRPYSQQQGSDSPIIREFKVGDQIVTREYDRATRRWVDREKAPRYRGDEGTPPGAKSSDSNVFSRLAWQAFGGTFDPYTGSFSALDKETARKATKLAAQSARLWRESGGAMSHIEAFQEVFEREANEGGGANSLPDPKQHRGKRIRDKQTGSVLRSDGQRWMPE